MPTRAAGTGTIKFTQIIDIGEVKMLHATIELIAPEAPRPKKE